MNLKKWLSKYWLILVILVFFLLRIPSLFEPFTYGDEGIYLTLGQAARKGLVWYRDIHDNKPPMLYLIAAAAGDFSSYRAIFFFWSLITLFAFYKLAETVFSKNKLAVVIATSGFTFLSTLHSFEGNVANAENFMLLLTIIAFYLTLKFASKQSRNKKNSPLNANPGLLILTGGLFSLAALFKIPAAFDFLAAMIFLFIVGFEKKEKKYLVQIGRSFAFLAIGFSLPFLLSIFYYAFWGGLNQYLAAAFFQNIPYLSSWG